MRDAIILAGGLGTRLREAVPDVPKPLASISGRPFLDLLIHHIEKSGLIKKIILAVGYKSEMIVDYYKGSSLEFSIETTPLGTGGAVAKAMKLTSTSEVFVFNGDSFFGCSLQEMVHAHSGVLTIACTKVEDTSAFGQVVIDEQMKICSFREKSQARGPGLINGGIYLFDRVVFDRPLPEAFSLERELIPQLIDQNVSGFVDEGIFIDIGTKESYIRAQTVLRDTL